MAITLDATAQGTGVTDTSLTWAHTCTGDNLALWVACGIPTADAITGVTYAGAAMSLVGTALLYSTRYIYLFYKAGPATGANNVVVSSSASHILRGVSASYTGVRQTGIPDANSTTQGSIAAGASITGTITTVADNCWTIMAGAMTGSPLNAGASTTERVTAPEDGLSLFDSNAAITPAGSASLLAQNGDAVPRDMGVIIASFAPFIATADTSGDNAFLM